MRRALLLCSLLWWACPGPNPSPDGGPKPAPSVSSVTPDHGPEAGGTMVTVAGANFQSGANVSFGGTPATQVIVSSPLILTARTPPGTGKVDVKVLNPDTQAATLGNAFTYQTVTQHVVSEALILNPADASDTSGSAMVSVTVVGQVEVPGVTAGAGQGAGVKAQVGYATSLSSPPAQGDFLWGIASYTADADGATSGDLARDQYEGQLMLPGASGMQVKNYYLAVRFSVDDGNTWTIGDRDGAANGFDAAQIPQLHVSQAQVGWCKLGGQVVQPPDQLKLKEGAAGPTVYAQVYAMSVTDAAGAGAGITGQLGYGPQGSDPATGWTWVDASYNTDTSSGANDEYQAALPVPAAGNYQFAYRFALGSGPYKYCDADGSDNGFDATQYGALQVTPVGIDWCNLQFPSALALKVGQSTGQMYGRVYGLGVTEAAGAGPLLSAEVGFGPPGSNPDSTWSWSAATYNQEEPNGQEEWQGAFTAPAAGSYSYTFRFSYDGGTQVYCDLDGTDNGVSTSQLGALTTTAVGIDDCQLEAPANVSTIPGGPTGSVTGLVHAASVTDASGQGANITGEVGYGPAGTLALDVGELDRRQLPERLEHLRPLHGELQRAQRGRQLRRGLPLPIRGWRVHLLRPRRERERLLERERLRAVGGRAVGAGVQPAVRRRHHGGERRPGHRLRPGDGAGGDERGGAGAGAAQPVRGGHPGRQRVELFAVGLGRGELQRRRARQRRGGVVAHLPARVHRHARGVVSRLARRRRQLELLRHQRLRRERLRGEPAVGALRDARRWTWTTATCSSPRR